MVEEIIGDGDVEPFELDLTVEVKDNGPIIKYNVTADFVVKIYVKEIDD